MNGARTAHLIEGSTHGWTKPAAPGRLASSASPSEKLPSVAGPAPQSENSSANLLTEQRPLVKSPASLSRFATHKPTCPFRVAATHHAVPQEDPLASYLVQPQVEVGAVQVAVERDLGWGRDAVDDIIERRSAVQVVGHELRSEARVLKVEVPRVLQDCERLRLRLELRLGQRWRSEDVDCPGQCRFAASMLLTTQNQGLGRKAPRQPRSRIRKR